MNPRVCLSPLVLLVLLLSGTAHAQQMPTPPVVSGWDPETTTSPTPTGVEELTITLQQADGQEMVLTFAPAMTRTCQVVPGQRRAYAQGGGSPCLVELASAARSILPAQSPSPTEPETTRRTSSSGETGWITIVLKPSGAYPPVSAGVACRKDGTPPSSISGLVSLATREAQRLCHPRPAESSAP